MADDDDDFDGATATVTCHLDPANSFSLGPCTLSGIGEKVVLMVEVADWDKCCPVPTRGRPARGTVFEIFETDVPEPSELETLGQGWDAIRSMTRKRFKTDAEPAGPELKLRRYVAYAVLGGEKFPNRKQFPFTFSLKRV